MVDILLRIVAKLIPAVIICLCLLKRKYSGWVIYGACGDLAFALFVAITMAYLWVLSFCGGQDRVLL